LFVLGFFFFLFTSILIFLSIWLLFGSYFFAVLMNRRLTLDYFKNHSGH